MLDTLTFMAPPIAASIIIVGMHSYLGIHVLKRGIIFVDLALAQIAALGTIVGLALGIAAQTPVSYILSLSFVFLGAVIFAATRPKEKNIPQEAIIGIVYGLSIAVAMAIADKLSAGGQHIKEILTGNLLWVNWTMIVRLALVYAVIAAFHIIFRHKFLMLTERYDRRGETEKVSRFWDFLFFVSFGIVISLSVPIAGVLLVFSFLMIPAAISGFFASGWNRRIGISWIAGVTGSLLGFFYSYTQNAPTGPAIICILGLFLLLTPAFRSVFLRKTI
jgi:zinc/manganese transport system permease protein